MTMAEIRAIASANGYSVSGSKKSELIDSYLKAQEGAAS